MRTEFFEEESALRVAATEGRADVIYAANAMSHLPDIGAVLRGVQALLAPNGVFVFLHDVSGATIDEPFHLTVICPPATAPAAPAQGDGGQQGAGGTPAPVAAPGGSGLNG